MEPTRPSDIVRRLYRTFDARDLDAMVALIHPKAEIESYAAGRNVLYGRDQVREVFSRTAETAYRVEFDIVEDLDDQTAVAVGSVRYSPLDGAGYVIGRSAWLWTMRDGLAWRCEVFPDREAAGAAWSRRTSAIPAG
jgi:ketosteroid isomerase-like protein